MCSLLIWKIASAIKNTLLMEGDEDLMSDIMFLAVKAFQGKTRSNEGRLSATGDLATLTANTGKDIYLAKAKVSIAYTGTGTTGTLVELKANGVVKETFIYDGVATAGGIANMTQPYEFEWVGKVATGQIIKLEVISIGTGDEIEGMIETFEEDTGESPRLPAQTQGTATIEGGDAISTIPCPIRPKGGTSDFTLDFKPKRPIVIKSFRHVDALGSTSSTVTETAHYDNDYDGDSPANQDIQASASNPLLVVLKMHINGTGSNFSIHASTTADTANGREIIKDASMTTLQNPYVPIILDKNEFLTTRKTNGASFTRSVILEGFTVELPSDFVV